MRSNCISLVAIANSNQEHSDVILCSGLRRNREGGVFSLKILQVPSVFLFNSTGKPLTLPSKYTLCHIPTPTPQHHLQKAPSGSPPTLHSSSTDKRSLRSNQNRAIWHGHCFPTTHSVKLKQEDCVFKSSLSNTEKNTCPHKNKILKVR